MINAKMTFEMDVAKVKGRYDEIGLKALLWLKNEVAKDSDPFVPFRANNGGTLARSVRPSIGTPDQFLVYNTPYARRMYYGTHFNFNRSKHPQATHHWSEKAKAVHKPKWMRGVAMIFGGNLKG